MPSRVTIRDIAAEAGVHFTTVGLALRDSPRISPETRKLVHAVAERLGYRPDPMLSALNAYRQTKRRPHFQATIAWVNNWPERRALLHNPDFFEYHTGAVERAAELGYEIDEFWLREKGMDFGKLRRVFKARNIQGVILAPQPTSNIEIDFDFAGLSAVSLSYSLKRPALHVITNHHFRSMRLMLARLEELGFRRIGLVVGREWNEKVGLSWLGGVLVSREVGPRGLEIVNLPHRAGDSRRLLAHIRSAKIDVVVSHRMVYEELLEAKARIPEEFGFANLSVEHHSRFISGVYQNSLLIGRKAVDQVVDMLHRGETGVPDLHSHLLIDGVWQPGTTLRPGAVV